VAQEVQLLATVATPRQTIRKGGDGGELCSVWRQMEAMQSAPGPEIPGFRCLLEPGESGFEPDAHIPRVMSIRRGGVRVECKPFRPPL